MAIKRRIELVSLLPVNSVAVEVGVASGLFSRDLLNAGIGTLYSVDAWETLNQLGDGAQPQEWHNENYRSTKHLLQPYGKRSIILRGKSDEMSKAIPDNSLDLVYLDGDHSLDGIFRDIYSYWPKLKSGGILATHDYLAEADTYGVKPAFENFAQRMGLEINLIPEEKNEDAGAYIVKP